MPGTTVRFSCPKRPLSSSSGTPPPRKTRFRPLVGRYRTGFPPAGFQERFQSCFLTSLSPFPSLAWRNVINSSVRETCHQRTLVTHPFPDTSKPVSNTSAGRSRLTRWLAVAPGVEVGRGPCALRSDTEAYSRTLHRTSCVRLKCVVKPS